MNSKYKFYPNIATGHLSDEDTKKYFSRIGIAVLALALGSFCASNLLFPWLTQTLQIYYPNLFEQSWFVGLYSNLASLFSIYCIGLPLFLLATSSLPKVSPFKEKMGVGSFFGGICVAMLAMSVGSYISNMILIFISSFSGSIAENPLVEMTSGVPIWITFVFSCVAAPILEELVFRKLLCDRILPLGEGYAILLSSAIFGLMHQNFYQFAYAFLIGLMLSLIYVKTGKLRYSIIYHAIVNLLGTIIGPWLTEQLALEEWLESGVIPTDPQSLIFIALFMCYSMFLMAIEIVGCVLLFRATKKKTIRIEAGILPPPKEHRFSNVFLNIGVAVAIAYFAFAFILSLL